MIIDTHCHILPGVDDGAKNADETRKMLRMAFKDGIDEIIATPHFNCDMDASVLEKRMGAYLRTCKYAREMNPKSRIYLGNELFYSEDVVDALDRGDALTLNETKYILVEFPVYAEFRYIRHAVQHLQYLRLYACDRSYRAVSGDEEGRSGCRAGWNGSLHAGQCFQCHGQSRLEHKMVFIEINEARTRSRTGHRCPWSGTQTSGDERLPFLYR